MKAKGVSILLFLCLLAPPVLVSTLILREKRLVRKEVKERLIAGIPRDELVLLTFSSFEIEKLLKWEHSREFEYEGRMYDIVETVRKGDTTSYWCWPDDAETELNQRLEEMMALQWGAYPEKNKQQKKWVDFFQDLFHPSALVYSFYGLHGDASGSDFRLALCTHSAEIPSPPPRR